MKIRLDNEKSTNEGAPLAAPAEFQIHLAAVSGKLLLFHGFMLYGPRSKTHEPVHEKWTSSGTHALNVPLEQSVS